MRLARILISGAAAMMAPACGTLATTIPAAESGREAVYRVPIDEARDVLASAKAPPMVFGDTPVAFALLNDKPEQLVWTVSQEGHEVMRYTADLEAAGDGATRISLTLKGSSSPAFGNVEERLEKSQSIRTLYLVAMQERIAADIERRPFDLSRVYPAMAKATVENLHLFQPPPDRSRETMARAYRDELEAGRNY